MMTLNFAQFAAEIKKKWEEFDPQAYWDDNLDARFYIAWQLQSENNKKILDIGCGSGIMLSVLNKSNQKFGLDISRDKILIAKKINQNSNFVLADIFALPFKENSFDLVMLNSIFYLGQSDLEKEKILKGAHYILQENGVCLLASLNKAHHSYRDYPGILSFQETELIFKKWFDCQICIGFNPFPGFPFFMPNIIAYKIPFIWNLILFLTKFRCFYNKSRWVLMRGVKKTRF